MIATSIKNIPYEEAYKLVYNSNADDVETLREIDDYLEHNIKPVTAICSSIVDEQLQKKCGNEIKIEVSGEDTIIMPFRGSGQSTTSRLRFGGKA